MPLTKILPEVPHFLVKGYPYPRPYTFDVKYIDMRKSGGPYWAGGQQGGWAEALAQSVQSLAHMFRPALASREQLPKTLRGLLAWHEWFTNHFECTGALNSQT